jgi:acetoin utilization deacetylase AcuC-like enzyme
VGLGVSRSAVPTGLAYHELCLWHDTTSSAGPIADGGWVEPGEPGEGPHARRRLKSLLDASGLTCALDQLPIEPASRAQLLAVHDAGYVDRVELVAGGGGGLVGPNAPIGGRGFEIARIAAGAVCAAVDGVMSERCRRAFALVRPAGHHASRASGMGNCVFNNVAVAAEHARRRWGVRRLAILDWDVHHGNGTEAIFYADGDVLTISLHQDGWYPAHTGEFGRRGEGSGAGANLNVPLPAGSGDEAYVCALDEAVRPAIERHLPELIVIACGLDANAIDPYGRMLVSAGGFGLMTRMVVDLAERVCEGRVAVALEGGYSPLYVPFCGLAVVEALAGRSSGVADPYAARYDGPFQRLSPPQRAAVDAARL